jgi:HD-like signal output (HDOD) protein
MSALTFHSFADDAARDDIDSATFRTDVDRNDVRLDAAANLLADLPSPARVLVRLASSGHADLSTMEQAFEEQPLVAESVLSLARALMSPHQACETVADVLAVVGPRTLGVLAAASVATGMLDRRASLAHATGRAMTVAALCRRVAPIAGASADDASLSGLLCDVGEAMLLRQKPDALAGFVEGGMSEAERIDRERARLGFDHAALGASALRSWGANEDVALAVRYHHDVVSALGAGVRVTRLVGVIRFCTALTRRVADMRGSASESIDRIAREESAIHLPLESLATDALCRAVRDAFVPYAFASPLPVIVDEETETLAVAPILCGICDAPWSGTNCPCCGANLCTAHETGHAWCLRCEANYIVERGRPERVLLTAVATTLFVVGGLIASGRIRENLHTREGSAVALLACGLATIAALCVRAVRRARFRSAEKSSTRERAMRRDAVTTLEKTPSSGSSVQGTTFRSALERIGAVRTKPVAPATPTRDVAEMRAPTLKVNAQRDSKTIRAKESPSLVRKPRKTPAKAAKKTSTGKAKKAPAKKTAAKRVSRSRTSVVTQSTVKVSPPSN